MLDLTTSPRVVFILLALGFAIPATYNVVLGLRSMDDGTATVSGTLRRAENSMNATIFVQEGSVTGSCPAARCGGKLVNDSIGKYVTARIDKNSQITSIARDQLEVYGQATERERRMDGAIWFGTLAAISSVIALIISLRSKNRGNF